MSKNVVTLKSWSEVTQGHMSALEALCDYALYKSTFTFYIYIYITLKVVPFGTSCMVSYKCSLVTLSLKRTVFEIFDL